MADKLRFTASLLNVLANIPIAVKTEIYRNDAADSRIEQMLVSNDTANPIALEVFIKNAELSIQIATITVAANAGCAAGVPPCNVLAEMSAIVDNAENIIYHLQVGNAIEMSYPEGEAGKVNVVTTASIFD